MPFRARPPSCPRCGTLLAREGARWSCRDCGGALVTVADMIDELLAVAPELRPPDGARDIVTLGRGRATTVRCPACEHEMEPAYLGGVEIDRCRPDALLWFDGDELERVVKRAAAQRHEAPAGLVDRLLGLLRG